MPVTVKGSVAEPFGESREPGVDRVLAASEHRLAQTEAAFRESEERLELALQVVGQGVYDWGITRDTIHYSDRFQEVPGLNKDELRTTQDWIEGIHPDDLPEFLHPTAQHKGLSDRFEQEYRYHGNDGGVVSVCTDITEVKQREQQLGKPVDELATAHDAALKARAQLIEAMKAISEGFVVFDAEDRLVLCNNSHVRFFIDAAGEEVGRLVVPGADREPVLKAAFERGMFPDRGGTAEEFIAWWRDIPLNTVEVRFRSGV